MYGRTEKEAGPETWNELGFNRWRMLGINGDRRNNLVGDTMAILIRWLPAICVSLWVCVAVVSAAKIDKSRALNQQLETALQERLSVDETEQNYQQLRLERLRAAVEIVRGK